MQAPQPNKRMRPRRKRSAAFGGARLWAAAPPQRRGARNLTSESACLPSADRPLT